MVKSVLGVNHQGLRDWLWQRITAIVISIYVVGLTIFFLRHPHLNYTDWHHLFTLMFVKVVTLMVVASIAIHAWVGMWTVFTDYIKPFLLRFISNIVTLLLLITFFCYSLFIMLGI